MVSGGICRYRFFDRYGGVGVVPFNSLNVSYGVGDDESTVSVNRRKIEEIIGFSALLSARQVHGDGIYCLTEPLNGSKEVESVDALITDQPGVGLMIQQADCQAVVLADQVRKVVAAVHCGWRGSVMDILAQVVDRMNSSFGVVPGDLVAAISPSLGPCCAEFINYKKELPMDFRSFMVQKNHFDFWRISRNQLVNSGLRKSNIIIDGICTCCSDDYFSYRRAVRHSGGITGRNCTVIMIDKLVKTSVSMDK